MIHVWRVCVLYGIWDLGMPRFETSGGQRLWRRKMPCLRNNGKKLQRGTSAASVAAFLVRKRALHTQTVIALNCLHHCRCLPFDLLSDLVASTSTLSLFLAPVFFHSPRPLEIFAALTDFMRSKLFQFVPSRFKLWGWCSMLLRNGSMETKRELSKAS